MNDVLIVFPWIGEFGWELMEWNALCRAVSRSYNKVIVYCTKGKEGLYSDFADETRVVEAPDGLYKDRWFVFHKNDYGNRITSESLYGKYIKENNSNADYFYTDICPKRKGLYPDNRYTKYDGNFSFEGKTYVPEYHSVGVRYGSAPDVIFHIRNRSVVRPNDNWSLEKWATLLSLIKKEGFSVACIGSKDESLHIDGASDFRGASILKTSTLLKSCKVSIGPESGPTHLAALSEGNHIVWSREEFNRKRCEDYWNPFGAKCSFICSGDPEVSLVFKEAFKYLIK